MKIMLKLLWVNLRQQMHELLRKTIRPEFLNRIDEIVLFKPLLKSEIRKIVDIQLKHVQKMLKEKEITLDVSDEAKDWLAQLGYDVTYGARPLKRVIQKYLSILFHRNYLQVILLMVIQLKLMLLKELGWCLLNNSYSELKVI